MKLNPPASSSDLEAARAIARRLHQRAYAPNTGAEVGPPPEPRRESRPERRPAPPPLPARPAPPPVVRPAPTPEPAPRVEAKPPAAGPGERPWSEPPPRREAWAEEPAKSPEPEPSERHGHERWDAPSPAPAARVSEPTFAPEIDVEEDVEVEEPVAVRTPPARARAPEPPALADDHEDDALAELTGGSPSGTDLEDVGAGGPSLDDDVGIAGPFLEGPSFERPEVDEPSFDEPEIEEPSFEPAPEQTDDGLDLEAPAHAAATYEPQGYEPQVYEETPYEEPAPSPGEVSPEDLIGSPTESPEVWSEDSPLDSGLGAPGGAEDLVEVATPSWDEVAEACLAHAGARGAMLVAASGQVLSARGDWPNPGPQAIAGRLVAMMERALRDAPTRSVSAPLAGQHLTAWRVPVADGLVTAVFVGDAALKADVRPGIDDEIRRAGGL